MAFGDFPTKFPSWDTSKIQGYQDELYNTTATQWDLGAADNTFTYEVPTKKIQRHVLMVQIPWPAELLVTRNQIIAALDGSTVVQCPDCELTLILEPKCEVAHCGDHWEEVPIDNFYSNWGATYGSISQGSNIHWKQDLTNTSQSVDFTQRILGEWRTK